MVIDWVALAWKGAFEKGPQKGVERVHSFDIGAEFHARQQDLVV